jgi:hypothetical protein
MLIGLALAAVAFFIHYPLGHSYKVYGFPFVIAVFERTQHGWIDYVYGVGYSIIMIILNALVVGLLPQFWLRKRFSDAD